MAKVLIDGFNKDIPNDVYHDDREYKSSSVLKTFLKNPREYYGKYILNEPNNMNKDALNIGSYCHTRILEPHLVEDEYAIWTGSRRSGDLWKEFKEVVEGQGKTIITSSQKSLVDTMIREYEASKVILGAHGNEIEVGLPSFFNDGFAEETLCGELEGYKIKTRFDYRKEFDDFGSINDLKTTNVALKSASIEEIEDVCKHWSYELSAALYVDLVEKETGKPHDFYFIFLSKKDYGCRIFKASDEMIERGRKMYKEAIAGLKEAEKTGVYFSNTVEILR